MSFTFEWDDEKAASNLKKHGVPFEEALAIFLDPHRIERYDDREAYGEDRFITVGETNADILVIAYTIRDDTLRIISVRKAKPHEQRDYRENR